ncbi:patatin-like phospholipase family protein [Caulobacter mirabilis]|uniref:Patatin n=1 Tax=Caulobacter mirabilis TaxID=69666 RepID=A0A2D2AU84_9CAUL|nr:patatin-like phospholipase family protein [Caulobacter mirabilis]ATQ41569.1 patatin [Caulobacter mirabilis]
MFARPLTRIAALAGALLLAACGTVSREAFDPIDQRIGAPAGLSDVRYSAADANAAMSKSTIIKERRERPGDFNVLALSGGGANGAYGAGVLAGWTAAGKRPQFDVVTGVSTGALTAPFAFLGSQWDDRLKAAYTDGGTEGMISFKAITVFKGPSFFSAAPVRHLVETYVTPEMLKAIAAEHAKGRRLLVATTNLDTQETAIWDMGAIATRAARGDNHALELFHNVLVASASIPGVFPPVMIEMDGPSGVFREMHVDGGVTTPFFTVPEAMMLWTDPQGAVHKGNLYVVINGQVGSQFGVTKGNLLGILARSYDAMSKASTRLHLAATAAFAQRNGLTMEVSEIPDEAEAQGLNFKADNMLKLFQMGYDRAAAGEAWRDPAAPAS